MFVASAIIIRVLFGLFLGLFLAAGGLFFGWFVSPPGATLSTNLLLNFAGLGAGCGAIIGWYKPEVPRAVTAIHLALGMIGGLAGAWAGWELGQVIYPEGVYNPAAPVRTPPFMVAVLGANVLANLLVSGFYVLRAWRYREY